MVLVRGDDRIVMNNPGSFDFFCPSLIALMFHVPFFLSLVSFVIENTQRPRGGGLHTVAEAYNPTEQNRGETRRSTNRVRDVLQ